MKISQLGEYILLYISKHQRNRKLGGGFKYFLFSSLPGEMIQFDEYFSNGLKPPTRYFIISKHQRNKKETKQSSKIVSGCHYVCMFCAIVLEVGNSSV